MDFKDMSPELREKAKTCVSSEELLELAREEGYELSDEELQSIAGGRVSWSIGCSSQTCSEECRGFSE